MYFLLNLPYVYSTYIDTLRKDNKIIFILIIICIYSTSDVLFVRSRIITTFFLNNSILLQVIELLIQ